MGKKGKPGKEKGKKKNQEAPQDDAMDLGAMAGLGIAIDLPEEEEAPKEKKVKVLSKKQLKRLQRKQEAAERKRLQAEKEALLIETKERVQREWQINAGAAEIQHTTHQMRLEQLKTTFAKVYEIEAKWWEFQNFMFKHQEWEKYLRSNRLPDPSSLSEMNAYMYVWDNSQLNIDFAIQRTHEVLKLLNVLDTIVRKAPPGTPPHYKENWKKVRIDTRQLNQDMLDATSFTLLRHTDLDLEAIDLTTVQFHKESKHLSLSLWAELTMPIPSPGKGAKHPLTVTLPSARLEITIPVSLVDIHKAVRALWLHYDHWSDRCRTFDRPEYPEYYNRDLYQLVMEDYRKKCGMADFRDTEEKRVKGNIQNLPPEPSTSVELLAWWSDPQRVLSEEIIFSEAEFDAEWESEVKVEPGEWEINLRETHLVGSLLFLDVYHIPPQPKYLRWKHDVTLYYGPRKLEPVKYYILFPPKPKFPEWGGEEEGDESMIVEHEDIDMIEIDLEEEIKKLVLVKVELPMTALWFESPKVAAWDPTKGYWSPKDIHDISYDPEEKSVSFRTGRLGLFGFYTYRYSHFLYQGWEMEPGREGSLNFYLDTTCMSFTFNVKESKVCVTSLGDAPGKACDYLLDKYFLPHQLCKLMREGGIEIFPPPDAPFFIAGAKPKNVILESHVYQVWGMFSQCFRFKSSHFNYETNHRSIIFQAKEYHETRESDYCLLQTSPTETSILDITEEEGEEFTLEPVPDCKFYADLYALLYGECTNSARRTVLQTSYILVQTLKEFMLLVRPLSFS